MRAALMPAVVAEGLAAVTAFGMRLVIDLQKQDKDGAIELLESVLARLRR